MNSVWTCACFLCKLHPRSIVIMFRTSLLEHRSDYRRQLTPVSNSISASILVHRCRIRTIKAMKSRSIAGVPTTAASRLAAKPGSSPADPVRRRVTRDPGRQALSCLRSEQPIHLGYRRWPSLRCRWPTLLLRYSRRPSHRQLLRRSQPRRHLLGHRLLQERYHRLWRLMTRWPSLRCRLPTLLLRYCRWPSTTCT